jgi:hypothetical protein
VAGWRVFTVREVHAAVEQLFGERVLFSSVNEALSTHASGSEPRFQRVHYGADEILEACVNSVGRACVVHERGKACGLPLSLPA